jgi:hypothetical protein
MEPRILVSSNEGINNTNLDESIERVDKSKMYEDNSTIIICPTRGMFPTRVVQSWMKLMRPMNQNIAGPIFAESMKVDAAYEALIDYILANEFLNKFKYILTIEEDNLPPSDGLLKLLSTISGSEYSVVSGLYWGKGDNGFPMIFGDPSIYGDYKPQKVQPNTIQEANALGMGFNLFKLDMFRDIPKPWFKTIQEKDEYGNDRAMTQDIYFYEKAAKQGYKFACNTGVLVGHYDTKTDIIY